MLTTNTTKYKLSEGKAVYGLLNAVPSPWLVEMIGYAGYDFVILDTEHLSTNPESVEHMIRATECAGITSLVRVPGPDVGAIAHALDSGAQGIVVPRVRNVEEARAVVSMARYAPLGERGITGGRTTGFGTIPLGRYLEKANREILVVVMIEDTEGIRNCEEIASVPGVDWLLEGAVDLSQSLGVPGDPFHPSVQEAIAGLAETCRKADRHFCALPRNAEQLAHWRAWGAQVFLLGEDRSLLFKQLKTYLSNSKA
ncbi:HpcH/HpaI aldolase family protein [Marinobacter sp.]|uniref:HpcH/HpaI aldolase family protein n=1 Tax=Marinobacter sp. TaxID=50741 RepID=UPI003A93AF10